MMKNLPAVTLFLCVWGIVESAQAQLFGPRQLGRPLQSRRGDSAPQPDAEGAGALQGDERFLRENRPRNAFVGTDRSSLEGFVGSGQAIGVGRVVAATESLEPPADPSDRINQPIPPQPANQMYYPRLEIDFAVTRGTTSAAIVGGEDQELTERLRRIAGGEVVARTTAGRTILQGTVASSAMARKLAIIASFEPHVSEIENLLTVAD
jgi:hypothetical protein